MDLFDFVQPPPKPGEIIPLNKRHAEYLKWKKVNHDVIEKVRVVMKRMLSRKRRFSMYQVYHHVRFSEFFEGYRDEPYRINNNHVPYLTRDLIEETPQLEEWIETRVCQGEDEAQESMERGEEV
jgi:hypothetical protein